MAQRLAPERADRRGIVTAMSAKLRRARRRARVSTFKVEPDGPGRWLTPEREVEDEPEPEPEAKPAAKLVTQGARSEPPKRRPSRRWLRPHLT
jgi:hypothetical protein